MVFKRRDRRSWLRLVVESVYPRSGWRRAVEYIGHRLKRLPDTPHKIALGFACGVFVSFSPFFGFHFVYAGLCALIVRGNILAAMLGTFIGNPLTFPIFAAASYRAGRGILGGHSLVEERGLMREMGRGFSALWDSLGSLVGWGVPRWHEVGEVMVNVFWPYLVGSPFPGLVVAILTYFAGRPLVAAYQKRRRERFLKRAEERRLARLAKKA